MTKPVMSAPDLADLLTALTTDELHALAVEMSADLPPGMLDQFDAATRDVVASVQRIGPAHPVPIAAMPDVLLVSVLDVLQQWHSGRGRYCLHAPHQSRPEPVYAAAWKPGLIVCGACTHLLRLPRRSADDRTCDLCGHVVAGMEHGEPIYPSAVQYGPLAYLYGACPGCHLNRQEHTA